MSYWITTLYHNKVYSGIIIRPLGNDGVEAVLLAKK